MTVTVAEHTLRVQCEFHVALVVKTQAHCMAVQSRNVRQVQSLHSDTTKEGRYTNPALTKRVRVIGFLHLEKAGTWYDLWK